MRFQIVGANKETGDDMNVFLIAKTKAEAEAEAIKRGIMVSAIKTVEDLDAIELVDEVPAASSAGGTAVGEANAKTAHGTITANPNSTAPASAAAAAPSTAQGQVVAEYHVVMNQSLLLMENAVKKYLADGWEPTGGLTIAVSGNSLLYFQAIMRKPKKAE